MRAIIFANGEIHPETAVADLLKEVDLTVAADGGARHCLARGLTPDVLIGDFDSLSAAELDSLGAAGAALIRYPARKDQTDLELALAWAAARGSTEVVILGALGGRIDHSAANLLLLASTEWAGMHLRLIDGAQSAEVLRSGRLIRLHGQSGETVSLIPLAGEARGITTSGLEYPLKGENLPLGSTRGVSNTFTGAQAEIRLEEGILLVVIQRISESPIHRISDSLP